MAASKASREFVIAFGLLKSAAIVGGLGLTVVSLMSIAAMAIASVVLQLAIAVVVALVVPLVIIDRALPENDRERARGVPTDVLALAYVGFALAFIGFGIRASGPLMLREADRLAAAGMPRIAEATVWLAGGRPVSAAAGTTGDATATGRTGGSRAGATATRDAAVDAASAAHDAGAHDARTNATPRPEQTPADLFRELAPTVVAIRATGPRGEGGGTGFFVDALGTIATNHHVIADATEVEVKFFDGTRDVDVELLADDPEGDLALLRVDAPSHVRVAPLGDSSSIVVGERAISIGNPLGLDYTLTDGLVSARRIWEGRPMVQMSVPVSPGNSGGPLFDLRGDVIGITTAQAGSAFERAQNLNLAIPIDALKPMIQPTYARRRHYAPGHTGPSSW